jgi:UDP-N-acetylglucosamine--N-acetylmuramyl-(pentapeptide) pyrophosphoryl-undecaprenol N-acetylglucosamine transferase
VSPKTVLIAGGGTGGHVFPAIAVAEAMKSLADVDVVFCGTARGLEDRVVPDRGFRLERLHVVPIKGGGPARAVRGALVALGATVQSFATVRALLPSAVLSVGGYAAGPISLAAAAMGTPLAILEPNSVVGLANRLLAPLARRAYLASGDSAGTFRRRSVRPYGVPLRDGFAPKAYVPRARPVVLVLGGSQGAVPLNERVPAAVAQVSRTLPLRVIHQCGRGRDASVRETYARFEVEGATVVPFVDDVASAIAEADLIIARAGAVTLAEISAIGRAALLIPFPHATDDHQAKNAEAVARHGAAVCLREADADLDRLAIEIHRLLTDDAARVAMSAASRDLGRPNAAYEVAADLLALAGVDLPERTEAKLKNGAAVAVVRGAEGRMP